jgi:hypothetical protein
MRLIAPVKLIVAEVAWILRLEPFVIEEPATL